MPGRSCTVCSHEDAISINESLVLSKQGNRRIAARYGLSEAAVRRHREHIPQLLIKASRAQEVADADTLLDRIEALTTRIEEAVDAVEADEDWDSFWRGVRELRANLELIGRITKELDDRPQVNVLIAPAVHEVIVSALRPYREARLAVSNALAELEANHDGG